MSFPRGILPWIHVLASPVAIAGSVSDSNLESWRLELARFGSDRFALVAQGSAPVVAGTLAMLDPGAYEAGPYRLRLTAADVAGRVGQAETTVELTSTTKTTRYVREETDFSASIAGHTLEFRRRYDSETADREGSFGHGWRLAWRDTDLVTDLPGTGREAFGAYAPLVEGTRAFLTLPTGERAGFTFAPERVSLAGITWYEPRWVADAGVTWQLTSVESKLQRAGDRFYDLLTAQPYNPAGATPDGAQYALVAPDGTTWTCALTRAGGYRGLIIWNSAGLKSYLPAVLYIQDRNLAGKTVLISPGHSITIGPNPIVLENFTP